MERTTSDLFKKAITQAFTTQPNIKLNADTIGDAMKFQQDMKEDKIENKEATGAASAGPYSAPLFTKEETKEDKLKGGLSDTLSIFDLAMKHASDKSVFKQSPERVRKMLTHLTKQLDKGIKVEMEHTDDRQTAKEIAMDHLAEDPNYYTKLKRIEEAKKVEATEATTTASTGAYSTPAFIAKGSKNWRGGKKPIYKGGKFVKIKKKCLTFPYCNQGAGAIDLSEMVDSKEIISNVSKRLGLSEEHVLDILNKINHSSKN